ncbi:MAG: hypothetical protein AAF380_01520, partial [Bacteroidota bacterium]
NTGRLMRNDTKGPIGFVGRAGECVGGLAGGLAGGLVGTVISAGNYLFAGAEFISKGRINKEFYYNQQEMVCKVECKASNGTFWITKPEDKVLSNLFTYAKEENKWLVLEAKPDQYFSGDWKIDYKTDLGKSADVKVNFYARKYQTIAAKNSIQRIDKSLTSLDNRRQRERNKTSKEKQQVDKELCGIHERYSKKENILQEIQEKCTKENRKVLDFFLQYVIKTNQSERNSIERAYNALGVFFGDNQKAPKYSEQATQEEDENKDN